MIFAESLGREISDYIKSLLNKEVTIVDDQQKVVVSGEIEKGSSFKLPDHAIELTSYKAIEIDGVSKILIPLKYQTRNVAFLLINDGGADIKNYAPLIKSFAELLVQQFFENNKPSLDSTDQYIIKLFNNYNPSNVSEYEAEAKVLGYNTNVKRIAISVYLKGFWDNCLLDFDQPSFERDQVIANWKRNIEQSFNSFFTKNADLIIAYVGNDRFMIFKAVEDEDEQKIKTLLKKSHKAILEPLKSHRISSITAGYGNAYHGIAGLISARREADLTLELGQRIWGENQSYYFGDLGILSILGDGDREKKLLFANQLLSKLSNEELNKTLECFFEHNLNLTETAERMGIHRNTVIYRLNQITKTLSADPRVFEQAMSIKIALMIRSLFG